MFSVPADNPELLKAQFAVFSRQIPLMYAIVLVNAWALSFISMQAAPLWLTAYVPAGFTVVCVLRLTSWWRARKVNPTPEVARKALVRTNVFAAIMAGTITAWALGLSHHADERLSGNIAFFMGITGVSVVVCLLHLRSAAFIVAIGVNLPFIVHYGLSPSPQAVAMAFNMLFVVAALLVVVVVQSRHFASSIDARTRLEAANRENHRLANLDSLTNLSNRRRFFSHLREEFRTARDTGKRLAVGVLDLDGFKSVNDLYGHVIGDALLTEVGRRLEFLSDGRMQVARLGGDEFALMCRGCGGDADLLEKGARVCEELRAPFVLQDATLRISGTMGFAACPDMADSAQELYERADYALYVGKRIRPGHATIFSAEHVEQIERSTRVEKVLRDANLKEELAVYFQPIVDSRSGKTVAFEALARWSSPTLGNVSPAVFVPVAERAGIVNKLTRVLLEKALDAASRWPEDLRLSFNLSTHDVSSSEGVLRIVGIIEASGLDPKRIDLEITETAMMYDFSQAKAAIEILRRLGCGVALDDFGTGYSSLSQLHALPLTKIKIDRSFVSGIDSSPASHKIVKSLLALSQDMGLDCVIEGVENREELAVLQKLGGWMFQGYLYSPPVPEGEVEGFLGEATIRKVV